MFQDKKAQTSMEFLLIFLFLIVFTFIVTYSINSTFDVNYIIYKIKNKTIEDISKQNNLMVIDNIDYSIADKDIELFVNLKITGNCPNFDYSDLETKLLSKTRFNTLDITIRCT
jgi:uncharacterized protein (UPF0333 family)